MNKDINTTLAALVPILRMNGEKVASIEAVHDWYKGKYLDKDGRHREYMKEVAEITYDNGHRIYADIGSDSNLTACFDVIGTFQQLRPKSAAIERIERGVYPTVQPEHDYKKAFSVACELLIGANLFGTTEETMFKEIMDKEGIVSSLGYEKYILDNLARLTGKEGEAE